LFPPTVFSPRIVCSNDTAESTAVEESYPCLEARRNVAVGLQVMLSHGKPSTISDSLFQHIDKEAISFLFCGPLIYSPAFHIKTDINWTITSLSSQNFYPLF